MIIYATQEEAILAEKKIWLARIKLIIADDRFIDSEGRIIKRSDAKQGDRDTKNKIINKSLGVWVDGTSISNDILNNRNNFPIMGFKGGKLDTVSGFTTSWDIPKEVELGEHTGKWAIAEPVGVWLIETTGIKTNEQLFKEEK